MASQLVTLAIDGTPTIDDYASALDCLRDLLKTLAKEVAPGVSIAWVVDGLDAGSAITALRGESTDTAAVERVADAYLEVGSALAVSDRVTLDRLRVEKTGNRLLSILNGRVPALRFETADDDVTITTGPTPVTPAVTPGRFSNDYGAVEGRIQTLSSRTSLRFTVFDLVNDRPVQCYLKPEQHDLVRDMWDHLAVVEGRVKRDPRSGRPTGVRQIRKLTRIDPVEENAWRRAHGVVSSSEPAEAIIRRFRDAN